MRKKIFSAGLLALAFAADAQILSYVGDGATVTVQADALVYSGGGMQIVGSGVVNNSGNVMVVGSSTGTAAQFLTTDAAGAPKTNGGNFILRLIDPNNFLGSHYGQLYFENITQANISGIVDKEYKTTDQGTYQQMAIPFSGKGVNTLASELFGGNFDDQRYSQNAVFTYNNAVVRSDVFPSAGSTNTNSGTAYYMVGTKNWNADATLPSKSVFTIKGKPYADQPTAKLNGAGDGINFGANGNAQNYYREKYNSYLQDYFDGATPWTGNFGKNLYQYSNPFLTNIDLSRIGYAESASPGDSNALTDIQGIRFSASSVVTDASGTYSNGGDKYVTFATNGTPTGDVNSLVIKPMEAFVIKMRNNSAESGGNRTLNFNTLRRFAYTARAEGTAYSVTAAKNGSQKSSGSVKQLGIIGLDGNGHEVERTYFVVYPEGITGHTELPTTQVISSNSYLGTYEELPTGGIDENYNNLYWLYINEANENNIIGKEIPLRLYEDKIKTLKFEILENAIPIEDGQSVLSSSEKFFIKQKNGKVLPLSQGEVVTVASDEIALYYGGAEGTLGNSETVATSRTRIARDYVNDYFVFFDPQWKKADIGIYDMSGRLVNEEKNVSAAQPYKLNLNNSFKGIYIVKIKSDGGQIYTQKIIK